MVFTLERLWISGSLSLPVPFLWCRPKGGVFELMEGKAGFHADVSMYSIFTFQ